MKAIVLSATLALAVGSLLPLASASPLQEALPAAQIIREPNSACKGTYPSCYCAESGSKTCYLQGSGGAFTCVDGGGGSCAAPDGGGD